MKKNGIQRLISVLLVCSLLLTLFLMKDTSMGAAGKIKKISLSNKRKTLYQGEIYTLTIKSVTPSRASKSVKWTTNKKKVATVSSKGVVKAKKAGTVKITATSKVNKKVKAACSFTIKKGVVNRSMTLNSENLELTVGQKERLKIAKWNPGNTKVKKVTWATSDGKVATVTSKGEVKAIAQGEVKVTAMNTYGKKAVCKVTVKDAVKPSESPTSSMSPTPSVSPTATTKPSTDPTTDPTVKPTPTSTPDDIMNNWQTPQKFDVSKSGITYGKLETVQYDSKTTGTKRKCNVLLPPNYSKDKVYPVLYLLHGIGGTHTEWMQGNPQYVIGNLIASKEAVDMIVVMPNVRAMADDGIPSDLYGQENVEAFDNFIHDLKNDLMPYIETNYPVSKKWEDTAIAGLSMGGREALYIGFSMLDRFAYIGAFSPAPGLLPGQLKEEDFTVKAGDPVPKVVLMCVGTSDGISGDTTQYYHNTLLGNGVPHLWYTMTGGHDFTVWKNGLYQFAKRIFK